MCKYKYNTHRKTGHFLKRHLNKKSYSNVKLWWIAKCSVIVRTFPASEKRPQVGVAHLVERRHEVLVVLEHRPDQLRAVSVYLEDRLHKLRRHLATGTRARHGVNSVFAIQFAIAINAISREFRVRCEIATAIQFEFRWRQFHPVPFTYTQRPVQNHAAYNPTLTCNV